MVIILKVVSMQKNQKADLTNVISEKAQCCFIHIQGSEFTIFQLRGLWPSV